MSDMPIESMDFKQLRTTVSELDSKLTKFIRAYNDVINNLGYENFNSSIVKESNNLKAEITLTAEKLKSVFTEEEANRIMQSMIKQSADEILLSVSETYQDKETTNKTIQSLIQIEAGNIRSEVSEKYAETEDVESKYSELSSSINQNADSISTKVSKTFANVIDNGKINELPDSYMPNTDKWDLNSVYHYTVELGDEVREVYCFFDSETDEDKVYGSEIPNSNGWRYIEGDSIYSSFTQTADGFALKGDFVTTTNAGTRVRIKGTKIDVFKGDDSIPKLSMGFDETSSGAIPIILLGAGDDTGSATIDGTTVYGGQGVIQKTAGQFIIQLYDVRGDSPGMYITKNDDGTSCIDINADAVNIKNLKITFG